MRKWIRHDWLYRLLWFGVATALYLPAAYSVEQNSGPYWALWGLWSLFVWFGISGMVEARNYRKAEKEAFQRSLDFLSVGISSEEPKKQ